jgi:curved DNA-binding protein CbpA
MDKDEAADILGVDVDADDKQIKERFRVMVKKNHPDQGGSPGVFKQIQTAKETLLTEELEVRESSTKSRQDARERESNQRDSGNGERGQSSTRSAKQGGQWTTSSSSTSTAQQSTPESTKDSSDIDTKYGLLKSKISPPWQDMLLFSLCGVSLGFLGVTFAIIFLILSAISYSHFNVFIGDLPGGQIYLWTILHFPHSLALLIISRIVLGYIDIYINPDDTVF